MTLYPTQGRQKLLPANIHLNLSSPRKSASNCLDMTDTVRIVVCGDEGELLFAQITIPNLLVTKIHRPRHGEIVIDYLIG